MFTITISGNADIDRKFGCILLITNSPLQSRTKSVIQWPICEYIWGTFNLLSSLLKGISWVVRSSSAALEMVLGYKDTVHNVTNPTL